MAAVPGSGRIELGAEVRGILQGSGPEAEFLGRFLDYLEALLAPDPAGLDRVVAPGGRFHELEAMGLPPGPQGLKMFRGQVNAAIPDERIFLRAVRFEGEEISEADMVMEATQTGEIFGIPATGRKIRFDVHERCRFADGKLAERWATVDLENIKRQLTGNS